jgi:glycosyltransferase involved in cell wall biosynthesis
LKILIVTDAWHPQLNGVVRTYEYLMEELERMGHKVKVISPNDFRFCVAMPGYPVIKLALFAFNALRRMIEDFSPDVLHIATEGPLGFSARKYAAEYGVEFTSCYHTHFPDYAAKRAPFAQNFVRDLGIRYVRWFHSISSCIFVATQSLEDTLKSWNFASPVKRMTRGVDLEIFTPGEKTLFEDIKQPVALYVGRIAVEKNIESFLSMDWPGSKVIVGDGPDRESLTRKFPDAYFLGIKKGKDLADCYRSADIFVFPSKTDTFGMVLIEALACGLPVAAYPVTGPVDIIIEPFLGVLNSDLSIAANQTLELAKDKQNRIEWVKAHYSWQSAARQFLES